MAKYLLFALMLSAESYRNVASSMKTGMSNCISSLVLSKLSKNQGPVLRGGADSKPEPKVPFCGPNPKDEFDSSDQGSPGRQQPETIHVPQDIKSVPEAVEVRILRVSPDGKS